MWRRTLRTLPITVLLLAWGFLAGAQIVECPDVNPDSDGAGFCFKCAWITQTGCPDQVKCARRNSGKSICTITYKGSKVTCKTSGTWCSNTLITP